MLAGVRLGYGIGPPELIATLEAITYIAYNAGTGPVSSKEIAAAVNSAIEALSDDLRQAITLREIEGLSYEEIAELMNCPIGTVRSRIFRAREAIAARLRPLLDTREGERW